MRRVRTALFLVLYRVIPSCHSWGFSPIAPSWGCPKGLKTKIWPELQLFCDYGLSQGVKAQIAAQNCSKSVVEQSPSALQMGERSPQSQKSCKKAEIFVFTTRSCVVMQQKVDYPGGVQDISFHVKQDAASESGFSERLARCSGISSARAVAFRRPRQRKLLLWRGCD